MNSGERDVLAASLVALGMTLLILVTSRIIDRIDSRRRKNRAD